MTSKMSLGLVISVLLVVAAAIVLLAAFLFGMLELCHGFCKYCRCTSRPRMRSFCRLFQAVRIAVAYWCHVIPVQETEPDPSVMV